MEMLCRIDWVSNFVFNEELGRCTGQTDGKRVFVVLGVGWVGEKYVPG